MVILTVQNVKFLIQFLKIKEKNIEEKMIINMCVQILHSFISVLEMNVMEKKFIID